MWDDDDDSHDAQPEQHEHELSEPAPGTQHLRDERAGVAAVKGRDVGRVGDGDERGAEGLDEDDGDEETEEGEGEDAEGGGGVRQAAVVVGGDGGPLCGYDY